MNNSFVQFVDDNEGWAAGDDGVDDLAGAVTAFALGSVRRVRAARARGGLEGC